MAMDEQATDSNSALADCGDLLNNLLVQPAGMSASAFANRHFRHKASGYYLITVSAVPT